MLNQIKSFFSKREMLKNMVVLAGGTTIAQLVTFGASPILSRIYTESDYGGYGIFTSIVSYLVIVACLRLDQAIVVPKSDEEARSIAQWTIKINLIVSSITLFLSLAAFTLFDLSYYLFLIAPTVLFMGLINTYNNYSVRKKTFPLNSKSKILTSLFMVVSSLGFGFLQFGELGLVSGMFLGQIVGGGYLLYHLNREIYISENSLGWTELRKKYRQFIFINTPNALVDLTESAGVVLLLGLFFDKENIGAYFFAFRILKMPMSLIGASIYKVLYKEINEKFVQSKSIWTLYKSVGTKVLLYSLPVFIIIFLFGEELFQVVFGDEWSAAGRYSQYFAPWFWLNFLASSVSCIPLVLNRQQIIFSIAIFNTIVRLLIISITGIYFTFADLILAFAIFHPIAMLINNYVVFAMVRKHELNLEKSLED